jgi:hypothetical protein
MTLRGIVDRPPPARTGPATGPVRAGSRRSGSRRSGSRQREPENVPARVRMLASGFAILVVALAVLVTIEVRRERTGLRVIGYETAPVVIASTDLYFALNDMDAQLANVLLVGRETDLGFTRQQALDIYHQRRQQVSQDLQRAAAAADADTKAARSIRDILDALGDYETLAAQMILLDQQSPHAAGQPSPATLTIYRQATDLLKARLLPPAQQLTDRNAWILERTYEDQRGLALTARDSLAALGLAMLVSAVVLQIYLARRFHRWVNPAVALAALAAAALAVSGVVLTTNGAEYFRAAKKDAFDSILALNSARAVSYDANADESRYLVDPQRAGQYEKAFLDKTLQLVNLRGATLATFDKRLDTALQAYGKDNGNIEWYGYYGTEFRNITFTGERAAAELALKRYQLYQADDRKIRRLATTGQLRASIAFCTSYNPGDSNWAFDQYDKALAAVIGINQNAFDGTIKNGERALDGWTVIPAVAGLVILGLLLLGLRPRLAEYHIAFNDGTVSQGDR